NQLIGTMFYPSREAFDESSIFCDMSFFIETLDNERNMTYPYQLVVDEPQRVKELHRDFIVELFRHLFEEDADKAINEFDYYINLCLDGDTKELKKVFDFNNRRVSYNKFENDTGFSMGISSIGVE